MGHYIANIRDIEFNLFEVLNLDGILDSGGYGDLDADTVRTATGYPIGGVPPFGHATDMPVFVDPDLLAYDEVWAAAGHPAAVFSTTFDELVAMTGAVETDVE